MVVQKIHYEFLPYLFLPSEKLHSQKTEKFLKFLHVNDGLISQIYC